MLIGDGAGDRRKKEPFLDVVESDLNARNFGKVGVVRQTGRQSSIFGLYSPSLSLFISVPNKKGRQFVRLLFEQKFGKCHCVCVRMC